MEEKESDKDKQKKPLTIKEFFKVLFISKDKIEGNNFSLAILKTINSAFWSFMMHITLIASILSVLIVLLCLIAPTFSDDFPSIHPSMILVYGVIGIVLSFIGFIFRIRKIESDKNNDEKYIRESFSNITTVLSIIITALGIIIAIKSGGK